MKRLVTFSAAMLVMPLASVLVAAPVFYSSQPAFLAAAGTSRTYDFEVASGFPASGGTIGLFDGIQFQAQTYAYPYTSSGLQAMVGASGTFSTATINFTGLPVRPNGFGFFSLDLINFAPEWTQIAVTFTTGPAGTYENHLAPGAPSFTPSFFGLLDTSRTIDSISLYATYDGTPNGAPFLIDDLTVAVPEPSARSLALAGLLTLALLTPRAPKRPTAPA